MLKLREQHKDAFSRVALTSFEDRVLVHLKKFFPDECGALGEARTRELIQFGIERAAVYGFTIRRDICKFIDVMFDYGQDFYTDPDLPWAAEILADRHVRDPSVKIDVLYDAAISHSSKADESGT